MPHLDLSTESFEEYPLKFDQFYSDNFGFRYELVELNATFQFHVFGSTPNLNVFVGKDGWFFTGIGEERADQGLVLTVNPVSDFLGQIPLTETELSGFKKTLRERAQFVHDHGAHYLVTIAPIKELIYPEFLPNWYRPLQHKTRYDQIISAIEKDHTVPFVDLRAALIAAKGTSGVPPLYYKTDGHWNFYGSLIAYRSIMDRLSRDWPEAHLKPLLKKDFEIQIDPTWEHGGFVSLAGLSRMGRDKYIYMKPRLSNPLHTLSFIPEKGIADLSLPKKMLDFPGIGERTFTWLENPFGQIPRCLFLGTSFSEKWLLYFSTHCRTLMFTRTVAKFEPEIITALSPNVVIEEMYYSYLLSSLPNNSK